MKIAIIGGSTRTVAQVLAYGQGWEVWGLNAIRPFWAFQVKWARWFNLHRWTHLVRDWRPGLRSEIDWARANPKIPFYVLDHWRKGALPNEVIFPRERLAKQPCGSYHAGSFDWLVAYAVLLKANTISLHGISLALDSPRDEPISARACLEYWCGYAIGRGIKVQIAPDCELFYQYHIVRSRSLYGYDDVLPIEYRA